MSTFLVGLADVLVAVLLVATIVSSARLSRRITALKGDEAAMRVQIGELLAATERAERAVSTLRGTVTDSERSLTARLREAEAESATLEGAVAAGRGVLDRLDAIVALSRKAAGPPFPIPGLAAMPAPAPLPPLVADPRPAITPSGDRLRAAVAAAEAIAARAARRSAA